MMDQSLGEQAPPSAANKRHKALAATALASRFLAAGTLAFLVDAAILAGLNRGLGLDPFLSRLLAISIAMIVGWQAHRNITFALVRRPSVREFVAYASVAWTAAAINYAIYAGTLIARPATPPLLSLVIASLITMVLSYLGMRFGVFGRPGSAAPPPH